MDERDEALFSLFRIGISIQNLNKKTEKQLGLSFVQWFVLKQLIDLPSVSAFSLARAAGVHPSTLTQTLKRLERKKYLFVMEDPRDSRKKLISITRDGKQALDSAGIRLERWSKNLKSLKGELTLLRTRLHDHVSGDF